MSTTSEKTGGQLLVDALKIHGAKRVFCVPGESYLPVLDALYGARHDIELVVCRHESGASNMAEAHGKMTGEPGICMVTRGPGATNASIGVHTAFQDSTPMILFIGQVGSDFVEREAFQEMDYRRMFGEMAKWVAQIDRADRMHEYISHAYHVATSGRPGPVVLALPEDMLSSMATSAPLSHYQRVAAAPTPESLATVQKMITIGKRPLAILGGSGWDKASCNNMLSWAKANDIPLAASFRCQDLIDNNSPNYVGHVGIGIAGYLGDMVRQADPLIVIGPRLGEMTTGGYILIKAPKPDQRMIHVHAGAEELGRVYQADLLINSGMQEFARALAALPTLSDRPWAELLKAGRKGYENELQPSATSAALDLALVVQQLQSKVGNDAIVTNGAGNYTGWVHRYWRYGGFRTQLAPTSGAMGYGLPAAISAKLEHPDRHVICFAGDGCFQMISQEMATASQYGTNILVLIVNNGMYGTIRMHQERDYPMRVWGTALNNPDFAAIARAHGGHGETVKTTAEFMPALERALASNKPAIIDLIVDPEEITTRTTITKIRQQSTLGHRS
jgi:acetolactate synthase I/II/III large subunit